MKTIFKIVKKNHYIELWDISVSDSKAGELGGVHNDLLMQIPLDLIAPTEPRPDFEIQVFDKDRYVGTISVPY